MDNQTIPEKLAEFVRKEAEKDGYMVVDISAKGGRGLFEIILDKEGGIGLDECSAFNRKIKNWAFEQDVANAWTLDVCSPGLDRVLKSDSEYTWAKEKQIKVNMYEAVNGKLWVVGKLVEFNPSGAIVVEEENGKQISIEKSNISKANLYIAKK